MSLRGTPQENGAQGRCGKLGPMPQTDLAMAISVAEGFGKEGAIPTRAKNPGDLVMPWLHGETLGVEGIHVFPDEATGWAALEHQLALIRDGRSKVYQKTMTLEEFGSHWTRTQQPQWVQNVVDWLCAHGRPGTTPQTTLAEVLG